MKILRIYHAALTPDHQHRDDALRRQGVDVTVVSPASWDGHDTDRPDVIKLPARRPGDVNRHTYVQPGRIAELASGVDLVDLHEEPFSAATHQLLTVLPRDLPVVCYAAQNIDKRWPPPFHRWERAALERLDGIYPCSRQAASVIRGKGFRGHVRLLPLGVDPVLHHRGAQEHDGSPFTLGMVGRLEPEKGVLDAIRVVDVVRRHRPTRLVIVGEGSEVRPAREIVSKLGLESVVDLRPWEGPAALADTYRQLHILLVPSRTTRTWAEQFGRVVVEARACGAVPVGYASGSLPDVVGPAGVLVPESDESALATAVLTLATNAVLWKGLRADTGQPSSWDEVATRHIDFWRAVLSGPARLPAGRQAASAEFGEPARIAGGGRPFALPGLRHDTLLSRGLAKVIDSASRGTAH